MLRLMREEDCPGVAEIHKQEFAEDDFLPSLGIDVLRIIYRGMLKEKRTIGYVVEAHNEIVGFIAGSEDTSSLFRECVKGEFIPLSYHVLKALIRRPSLIPKLLQTLSYNKKAETETAAELISIAIKTGHKRRGLGRSLVDALITDMRRRGIGKMKVVVNRSNIDANSFYERIGFIHKDAFKLYNKEMNLYILNL